MLLQPPPVARPGEGGPMKRLCCLAAALLAACAAWVAAQDQPPPAAVNKAIDKGVAYLRKIQKTDGSWPRDDKGATPLAGWTLLECGASPNDPAVQKAAEFTRSFILTSNQTYDIALAILFLDRLGDPEDEPLIEALALQLLASQSETHGWTYACQELPEATLKRLQQHLAKVQKDGRTTLPEKQPDRKPRDPKKVHADVMAAAQALNKRPVPQPRFTADGTDNSNTQFALLALWVARRHGMPVETALWRVELRFRGTQQRSGGWSYEAFVVDPTKKVDPLAANTPTAAMTACGLLALAVGNINPPPGVKRVDLDTDALVKAGLYVLSATVGAPGQKKSLAGRDYYFLWTLERMAVIYNFKTIGGKDWYRWGAELLLANQKEDGGWQGDFAQGGCDTCFALLFLKRANVASDLTILVGDKVKDPGKAPDKLLDLIGQEVEPGVGGKQPRKNVPNSVQAPSQPPAGAGATEVKALFNGKDLSGWKFRGGDKGKDKSKWSVVESVALDGKAPERLAAKAGTGVLLSGDDGRGVDLLTEAEHGDCELHVEFVVSRGSNSGVYFQGQYEVQIFDSFGKADKDLKYGDCGGIYNTAPPRTNACKAPGEWQSFDVVFRAPRFDKDGKKTENARFVKVVHNGVTIHENVEVKGPTTAALGGPERPLGPLMLQGDHGPVAFRNLRIKAVELK
jgi:hypothetical protein